MERFEYIRCFWKYIDNETPVVLFYEVDCLNERYAVRMTEIFPDRSAKPVTEFGFDFVTDAPVPSVDEINENEEFFAEVISKEVFEAAYACQEYPGPLSRP